jgi:hypothetical protein
MMPRRRRSFRLGNTIRGRVAGALGIALAIAMTIAPWRTEARPPMPEASAGTAPSAAMPAAESAEANERPDRGKPSDNDKEEQKTRVAPVRDLPPPDLTKLRADYDRLREELFKARVRSQKAAEAVYSTHLDVRLRWKGEPDFVIRKARFLLDGTEIWDSGDRAQTDDSIEIASRAVKPGPHALSVTLEIRPRAESKGGTRTGADKLGYTSEHVFAILVAAEGQTHVVLTGDEDGSPPEYEPELELEVKNDK